MNFYYPEICNTLLKNLPERTRVILEKRFGLTDLDPQTLESIGKDFKVTRERIRQIEKDGFLRLKPEINPSASLRVDGEQSRTTKKYQKVFNHFKNCLKKTGNLRKEDKFLAELAGDKFQNQVYFLLTLGRDFERVGETKDFYPLWTIDQKSWVLARKIINSTCEKFKKIGKPLKLKELTRLNSLNTRASAKGGEEDLSSSTTRAAARVKKRFISLTPEILTYYLEISKKIQKNKEGFWGLKDWPEINPKRIKDKAYLVFRKTQKPLHFSQVANLIDSALPQTVHNELIKDDRFVLVGRGIYALKEWGYEEGLVKDVISKILKAAGRPLKKEEILEKTLKQRLVKENTIFLNLSNKKYFLRNSEGYYINRED